MKFMLFAPVVGVKDVTNAIMDGSVISMLMSFTLTQIFATRVMVKTVQNVNDSDHLKNDFISCLTLVSNTVRTGHNIFRGTKR